MAIDKLDLLKTHILFRSVNPKLLKPIAQLAITRELDTNECLFLKGDEGDALYGVLSGCIRISASAPSGKEITLNILYPGDIFGEIALLDGKNRTAGASATMPTKLLCIQRGEFLKLMRDVPDLTIHLLDMLCDRLRKTNEIVEDTAFLSLGPRLAKRLLNLARYAVQSDPTNPQGILNISQSELGQMMGVTRESINKYMRNWRNQGWIALRRNQITLLQKDALQQLITNEEDG